MPRRLTRQLILRTRLLLGRWRADTSGVAAIEFALIAPTMATMFLGAVELSQAITVDRRVTQVASSTADLVARADKKISQTEIKDIMRAGSYILKPYSANPVKIVVRNVTSSSTEASQTKQSWTCAYSGTGEKLDCSCTNMTFNLPAKLVTTNDSVVVSEVTYDYVPLLFDKIMKKVWSGTTPGVYQFKETIYTKPRSQAAMLLQADNTTPCPMPTF